MANIFSISQSALAAAQVGLATTAHNIANASTPGYSRQVVIQGALGGQNEGFGFVGKGTEITEIRRVFSEHLNNQAVAAQTSKSQLGSYYTQIKQINNMLADPDAGLSPALQDFFKGVQNLSTDANDGAARQSLLSSAETLAARFQSLDGQLSEIREGVNTQIQSSIGLVNTYARQIAKLNDTIEKAQTGSDGKTANDLLDQRDQLVADLSKEVKVSVVKQNNSYNVFIGNGQPLVLDNRTYDLVPVNSTTDSSGLQVGYVSNGVTTVLEDNSLPGGNLGGLFEFRSETLDAAQNALGRVAIGLATAFNDQHRLGMTQDGALGGDFFTQPAKPVVTGNSSNTRSATLTATFNGDAGALTTSDYRLEFADAIPAGPGGNPAAIPAGWKVTRLADGKIFTGSPTTVDGVDFTNVNVNPGDNFTIRPTALGAGRFAVAVNDKSAIAAAAPIRTAADIGNAGTVQISAGVVDKSYPDYQKDPATQLAPGVTLTYNGTTKQLEADPPTTPGFPMDYASGMKVSFNGVGFTLTGVPADGDKFSVGINDNGRGDSRNALLLGALQSGLTLDKGSTSFQGAYSQMVNDVGNKTRELEVTSAAADKMYTQTVEAQQAESGVNLDEEATNLLRYQQAYQAAGKVMQTVNQLFEMLVSMGQ